MDMPCQLKLIKLFLTLTSKDSKIITVDRHFYICGCGGIGRSGVPHPVDDKGTALR